MALECVGLTLYRPKGGGTHSKSLFEGVIHDSGATELFPPQAITP